MSVIKIERLPLDLGDRPLLARAFDAWRVWAGDKPAPAWKDVSLLDVPARLLPTSTVVDVLDGGADYSYRFWGTGMSDLFAVDETGKRMSQTLRPGFLKATFEQLGAVIDGGEPAYFRVTMRQPNGVAALKLNLRLPVMDLPGEVTKLVTVSQVEPLRMHLGDDLSPTAAQAKKVRFRYHKLTNSGPFPV